MLIAADSVGAGYGRSLWRVSDRLIDFAGGSEEHIGSGDSQISWGGAQINYLFTVRQMMSGHSSKHMTILKPLSNPTGIPAVAT
jgi:hypothetical protein